MKARTIGIIRDILNQNRMDAWKNYDSLMRNLREKYGAKYEKLMNESEEADLYEAHGKTVYYEDLFQDFESHVW